MNTKTAVDRVLTLFLIVVVVSVQASHLCSRSVLADSDLSGRSKGVAGSERSDWSFDRAREWGDFACVDGDSAELVLGVRDVQLDDYNELAHIAATHGGRIVNTVATREEMLAVVADIPFEKVSSFANEIRTTGLARYIEPNMRFQTQFAPNDPYWSLQWGPQKVEADWAWNTTIGDPSVLVAIVDTGVDYNHPDLAANYVALGYDWVNMDSDPKDDNGHGTHCAGIIAAEINNEIGIAGMAQIKFMAEKGIDSIGFGSDDDLANALIHAVDQGADILSNSWGGYEQSELMYDAIKYAENAGVLIVAAAGNNANEDKHYPSAYSEVIGVTATDQFDNPAAFTNFGNWVEVAAPGVDIYSTLPTYSVTLNEPPNSKNLNYDYLSGTSMACPHVAGVAALIWSRFPGVDHDWVRARLRCTSDDLGEPGFDEYYGYGRVNARKAVEQALPDHDLWIFDRKRPIRVNLGDTVTFSTTVINFGTGDETNVEVQLLVDGSLLDSTSITLIPWGTSATVEASWTPTVAGRHNVTSYVVPVSGETMIQNNRITEIIFVVAPPPETYWTLLATDPDEGFDPDLQSVHGGPAYFDVIFFKVTYYRPWVTIDDMNIYILIDSDQNPATGLLDAYYGGNAGIGADYLIKVGGQEPTGMYRWDPMARHGPLQGWWDLDHPILLAYLNALENSNVFVVGVYFSDVQTSGVLSVVVWDCISWDWIPDNGHISNFLFVHNPSVSLEAPPILESGGLTLLDATVCNIGSSSETNVELQLLINGTLADSTVIPELASLSSYTLRHSWTPAIVGVYNITAYVPPVPFEEFVSNNIAAKSVQVMFLPNIFIVSDDDAPLWDKGTSLREFEWALTAVGLDYVVWNESTMGHPPLEFLLKFRLVTWTCGDYSETTGSMVPGAVDSTDAATLEAYFLQGGNILLEGGLIAWTHFTDPFMTNVAHAIYQYSWTWGDAPGLTVTDPDHPVTQDLPPSSTWSPGLVIADGVTPVNQGAEVIRYTDTEYTAVTVYDGSGTTNGSVVYCAFPMNCLGQPERDTLIINSVDWLLKPVHDVVATNVTPSKTLVGQGYSASLNVTVANEGDYIETFVITAYYGDAAITPAQWETFWSMGDVNRDGYINGTDQNLLAAAFGATPGSDNWNGWADLNQDFKVDVLDAIILVNNYGLEIWIYAISGGVIGTQTVVDLHSGAPATLTFTWDTTGIAKSNYAIAAYATPIYGVEIDRVDNTCTNGAVTVVIPGDVNADGIVNVLDAAAVSAHWYPGPPIGSLGYDPNFDINGDRSIDVLDAGLVSAYWTGPPKGPLAP